MERVQASANALPHHAAHAIPVIAAVPRGGATWKFLEGVAELIDAGDPKKLATKIE